MRKILGLIIISMATMSIIDLMVIRPHIVVANDNDKVLQAKNFILKFVSHPDSVKFDNKSIEINKDIVSIRFSYTNGIGVTETITMNVKVD